MTIGAMVGPEAFSEVKYLMHAKQMQALDLLPRDRRASSRERVRAGFRRARPHLPSAGRRDDRGRARLGARARSRTSSTSCASEGVRSAPGDHCFRPYPLRRSGRRSGARSESSCSRRRSPSGPAASLARTCGSRSRVSRCTVYDVVAGLGGRPITKHSLHALFADVARAARAEPAHLPRPELRTRRARAGAPRSERRSGPHAENILRDIGTVARRVH